MGFPGGAVVKNPPASAGNTEEVGSVPESGRSLEKEMVSLQYTCLGKPMERGAWWATVHGATKNQTQLINEHTVLC